VCQRREDSQAALFRGVFGVPSDVSRRGDFWSQDRLDFMGRRLADLPDFSNRHRGV
jgi:2-hydroxychromene-2-carboxylate isomerase